MTMRLCFLDYETFWSATHSLTKMNPIVYVTHPETEIQSVAMAFDDGPIDVLFGEEEIRKCFDKVDWSQYMVVAHNNAGFDALISSWRFGIRPKAWACTLAMAKPFFGLTVGGSLKKVAEELDLGDKGSLDAVNTKGKKLADFTPDEIAKMRVYNQQDTHLCREIFHRLMPLLSVHEMKLIDMTIRMTVEPEIEADIGLLQQALVDEVNRKNNALLELAMQCGVLTPEMDAEDATEAMRKAIKSTSKFVKLLEDLGAEIPMKVSPTMGKDGLPKLIPALAKNDEGLEQLLEHPDIRVQVAAQTRLETNSSQLETRLRTFIDVSQACGGRLPMPLNYCGATISWRHSGTMKMNVQNMPRVNPSDPKPTDALRSSLRAPKGKKIVVVDSSNIELRVAHGLSGAEETMERLRSKEDLYCWFASALFGRDITKADKNERFIGKVAMLSLQYGASWRVFQNMVRIQSGGKTLLDDDECKRIVLMWRDMFPAIANKYEGIWTSCDRALMAMLCGEVMIIDRVGLCEVTLGNRILTPNNHWLQYPELRKELGPKGFDEWKYGEGRNTSRIYGAMLFENLCQHIARLIVMEQTVKLHAHYPVKLSCHDEAVALVDEDEAEDAKTLALEIFSTPPKWWPDLPLAAEADIGNSYAEAK